MEVDFKMILTNDELFVIAKGLEELSKVKLNGKLALRIFRNKKKIDDYLAPAFEALQAVEDVKEKEKIAFEKVDIDLETFKTSDLENLEEITADCLIKIGGIIED